MEDPGRAFLREELKRHYDEWFLALAGKRKALMSLSQETIKLPRGIRNILIARAEFEGTSPSTIVVDSLLKHLGIPTTTKSDDGLPSEKDLAESGFLG